jgi:ubiquinone/menaquinone biosynthesis C-methylase UbiE
MMQNTYPVKRAESAMDYPVKPTLEKLEVPEYLQETYWWAYLHPRAVKFFERQWIVNLILWGNFVRLRDAALDEMGKLISGRTLQVACVYGDFTASLMKRMGLGARLDVVDVAPIQLENLRRKIGDPRNVVSDCQNSAALSFADATFDQTVVFFLLHEQPSEVRMATVREAMRVVKPGGKVVIVDYHRPVWQHPHRYIMAPILKTLEPFALDLWRTEIAAFLPEEFAPASIEKTTFFGGLYQKVVITR